MQSFIITVRPVDSPDMCRICDNEQPII